MGEKRSRDVATLPATPAGMDAGEEDLDPFIGLDLPVAAQSAIRMLDSPPLGPREGAGGAPSDSVQIQDEESGSSASAVGSDEEGEAWPLGGEEAAEDEGDEVSGGEAEAPHDQALGDAGVTDEAELPLWMRSANARIIGEHTPPIRALALDPRLEAALVKMGVKRCFPVQATVVPMVLAAAAAGVAGDICCCAPTGSGKTLAYSLSILQHLLSASSVRRLRALVLLPTRGLALQVFGVLSALCEHLPLKVGLAVGMDGSSWEEEREALLGRERGPTLGGAAAGQRGGGARAGGSSAVDVLVATPGRLVEHLRAGGGFTLQHLRWLVIDEADRLLMHGFQAWLPQLLEAAYAKTDSSAPVRALPADVAIALSSLSIYI